MRRSDFIYTAILLPLDYIMLICAGLVSYQLRKTEYIQSLDIVSNVFYQLPGNRYFLFLVIMAAFWLILFKVAGLYNPREIKKFLNQVIKIFLAGTAGISAIIIFLFFRREFLFSSRFIILAAWILTFLFVLTARGIVRIIRRILLKYSISAKPIIVIGGDRNTQHFIRQVKSKPGWGYNIVDKVLTMEQLSRKVREKKVYGVILTDLSYSREKMIEFLEFCQVHHIDFRYAADIFSAHLHNIDIDAIAGFPLIEIKRTPLEGWGRVKKRMIDFLVSLIVLLLLIVPGSLIASLIKLTSKGPIFVKLKRVGEGGHSFKILKFRSMIDKAYRFKKNLMKKNERRGPLFKIKNDPRITPFGKFLRRFSLDELPNFYNVLIGNMSLVGPRPHEPEEVNQYQNLQKRLLNIKPGITGPAQISGRSSLAFDEEARLDLYYIENWSLKMDFTILLKTPFAVLMKREDAV